MRQPTDHGFPVPLFKPGDLVMLKSGGPTMTVDTVNTDIFDDDKMTGVLCTWFVGDKLERLRFDHSAIESAPSNDFQSASKAVCPEQDSGEYKVVLDEMVAAMNVPSDSASDARKQVVRKPKPAGGGRAAGAGGHIQR